MLLHHDYNVDWIILGEHVRTGFAKLWDQMASRAKSFILYPAYCMVYVSLKQPAARNLMFLHYDYNVNRSKWTPWNLMFLHYD